VLAFRQELTQGLRVNSRQKAARAARRTPVSRQIKTIAGIASEASAVRAVDFHV
jgi:hypothetical protein